ncbi:hypothetical protein IFR05_016987, partial [Cadophora sp. M221]
MSNPDITTPAVLAVPAAPVNGQDVDEEIAKKDPLKYTNDPIYPPSTTPKSRHPQRWLGEYQVFDAETGLPGMCAQARIQSQADDVLRQLEPLPAGPFGPEHQLIIARNMALIQGVTADSLAEREEAERKGRAIEWRAREAVRLANPGYEPPIGSDYEGEGKNVTPAPGGGNGGGVGSRRNKRKRSNDDDGDDEKKPKTAKQIKRARLFAQPELQIQDPVDISKLAPLPIRIEYPAHPTTDRSDAWFIDNFTQLYRQVEAVCSHYYGLHKIPDAEPWLEFKATPEFVKWAEQGAEPDPRFGSWDEMLRDRELRKWFVMAVVMKVFKVKVFDLYLFGATAEETQLMHQVDRAFLGREGFQREELRAKQASTILGSASVTANFYPSVAKLTAQIALLLSPLTTYLYSLPPPVGTPAPLITSLYQSLHNLVSQAAYLSLCVKLTPSIIQMHDLRPGDRWHPDDMHCLDTEAFVDSKRTIGDDWRQERHSIRVRAGKKRVLMEGLEDKLSGEDEGEGEGGREEMEKRYRKVRGECEELERRLAEKDSNPPSFTHRALIKLAVWPVIRRYTPGSAEEEKDGKRSGGSKKPLREKDGFRIFMIGKGAVLAYCGREVKREDEYCGLGEWVGIKERQREVDLGWASGRKFARVLSIVTAVLLVGKAGQTMDQVV